MKLEKQQLLHDLLEDQRRDQDILLAAASVLRRRRQWRVARQLLMLFLAAGVTVWFAAPKTPRPMVARVSNPQSQPATAAARSLTDAELLGLFPDMPVGLATLPDGKKLLIFPHPGDQDRYVTRL